MITGNVNIKDIARLADVGVATVSRVINNSGEVKEATRKRVQEIIKEYNYVPNNYARNLKRSRSDTVCVLTKSIANPLFNKMLSIIQKESIENHYNIMVQQIDRDEDELDAAIAQMKEQRLRGIILLGGIIKNWGNKFRGLDIPLVMVTSKEAGNIRADEFSSIAIDDRKTAYEATKYLLRLGHREIAFMASELKNDGIMKLRLEGYKEALNEAGLLYDEALTENASSFSIKSGYQAFQTLNQRCGGKFTAVLAIADTLAIGCLRAAKEAGYQLPEDLSVMGFDGIEFGAYYFPSLTTVRQPYEYMAEQASFMMRGLLANEDNRHMVVNAEIVERESCAKRGK